MTRTTLLALAALLAATAAKADDMKPYAAQTIALADATGVVYYTKETAGFRVVATVQSAEGARPMRFVATLADGQALTVSVPAEVGAEPREIEIARTGDRLTVNEAETPMIRASLD